ncbi:MAG TPA: haloacid dehalogenase type II [Gammaproteobacteria bacterium]|nr:haloacid dehalogenase type II [Gammaproteobacteria bacterium]
MPIDRRAFVHYAAAALAAAPLLRSAGAAAKPKIRAVAFDAFPIFDPRPVFALCERLFPDRGAELVALWRTRQFEYQWLRALAGPYADFRQTTEDALVFAAESLKLDLSSDARAALMQAYLELPVWPDVPEALASLGAAGLRLAFLSNATRKILDACVERSALGGVFEHVLSTDEIRTYKPDPRAYRMAVDAFGLAKQEILFVASAGWDAAGAKSFGYPALWVNRSNLPAERLGAPPDGVGATLADLVSFVAR